MGQVEISAGRELPGHADRFCGGTEEALCQSGRAVLQARAQRLCLECGYGHPLAVDGIEAADSVAEYEQPGRKSLHLVVASPLARGGSVLSDQPEWLGVPQCS